LPFEYAQGMQALAAGLALDAHDLEMAKEWLEAHDRWLAWSGAMRGQSEGAVLWAEYHRRVGDLPQARAHAERALAYATAPRQPLALLAAHRLLGELETEAGQIESAAAYLDASLRLADACAAPYERALTLLAQAELRAAIGETVEGCTLLDEVMTICEPLGATPTLQRAVALAARLATSPTAPPSYPAGLSAREVEVLRLVAAGLTNPQVAERLFLSRRTVEQHLRSVFDKTGTPSRAAAARWAAEHDLI
jgi:DNA-binding CsgD family transcriptional regulator